MNNNQNATPSMNPDTPSMDPSSYSDSNVNANPNTNSNKPQETDANDMNFSMGDGQKTQDQETSQGQTTQQFAQGDSNQPSPKFQEQSQYANINQNTNPNQNATASNQYANLNNQYANTQQNQHEYTQQNQYVNPNNQYANQGNPNQPPQQEYGTVNNVVTILLLIFFPIVGIILMWVWTGWKTWVKVLLTVLPLILIVIGVMASMILVALNPSGRFSEARDAQGYTDTNTMLTAIHEYVVDNDGLFPWEAKPTYEKPPLPGEPGLLLSTEYSNNGWTEELIGVYLTEKFFVPSSDSSLEKTEFYIWLDEYDLVQVCFEPESEVNQSTSEYNILGEKVAAGSLDAVLDCVSR